MRAVGHHGGPIVGVHLQEFRGIVDAGVAIGLALLVQREGRGDAVLAGQVDDFLFQRGDLARHVHVYRVVAIEQAVGQNLGLNLRLHGREPAQCFDESGIALDFNVQARNGVVKRAAVLVEVLVVVGDFFQGEGQVESHVLILRVKQDGEFVGLLDDIDQALVLLHIVFVESLLCLGALAESRLQFVAKFLEHVGHGASAHDGHEREVNHAQGKDGCQDFLSHCFFKVECSTHVAMWSHMSPWSMKL